MPLFFLLIINRIKVLLLLRLCVFDTNLFAFITDLSRPNLTIQVSFLPSLVREKLYIFKKWLNK